LRLVRVGEQTDEWADGVAALDNLLWSLQPLSCEQEVARRDEGATDLISELLGGMAELGCPSDEMNEFGEWLSGHLDQLSLNDRAFFEEEERPEPVEPLEPLEEIVLAAVEPDAPSEPVAPEFLDQLKAVNEGTWVELEEDRNVLRCKLATITQPGNTYVFVNRRGMKVMEKSRFELAVLLQNHALKVIDESQVFDRALQSVIGNLRQMQRDRG